MHEADVRRLRPLEDGEGWDLMSKVSVTRNDLLDLLALLRTELEMSRQRLQKCTSPDAAIFYKRDIEKMEALESRVKQALWPDRVRD